MSKQKKNGSPYIDEWDEELYDILISRFDELQERRKSKSFKYYIEKKESILENYSGTVKKVRYEKKNMHGVISAILDLTMTDEMLDFTIPKLASKYLIWICEAVDIYSLNDRQKRLLNKFCVKYFNNKNENTLSTLSDFILAIQKENYKQKEAREKKNKKSPSVKERDYDTLEKVLSQFLNHDIRHIDRIGFIEDFDSFNLAVLTTVFVMELCQKYKYQYNAKVAKTVKEIAQVTLQSPIKYTDSKEVPPVLIRIKDNLKSTQKALYVVRAIELHEEMCRKISYMQRISKKSENRSPLNLVDLHEVAICLESNPGSIKNIFGITSGEILPSFDELVYLTKDDIEKMLEYKELPYNITHNIPIIVRCVPLLGISLVLEISNPREFIFKVVDSLGLFYPAVRHLGQTATNGIPHVLEMPSFLKTKGQGSMTDAFFRSDKLMREYENELSWYELCITLAKGILFDDEEPLPCCEKLLGSDPYDDTTENKILINQYEAVFNISEKSKTKGCDWNIETQNGLIEKTVRSFYEWKKTPKSSKFDQFHAPEHGTRKDLAAQLQSGSEQSQNRTGYKEKH